jgi:hypothetical protein
MANARSTEGRKITMLSDHATSFHEQFSNHLLLLLPYFHFRIIISPSISFGATSWKTCKNISTGFSDFQIKLHRFSQKFLALVTILLKVVLTHLVTCCHRHSLILYTFKNYTHTHPVNWRFKITTVVQKCGNCVTNRRTDKLKSEFRTARGW